jgi:hypothetical protein
MNTIRNNPFDKIDGQHLLEAIAFFKAHHPPCMLLDAALLSAHARGHLSAPPRLSVGRVSTPELLRTVRGNRVAEAYVTEVELRNRIGKDTPSPRHRVPDHRGGWSYVCQGCNGHESQIY